MTSIVALDLETTGLDPNGDAIIEIGAVRFSGRRIEDEFDMLVNPGRPIPPFISQMTGITNEMVRNAPPIKAVIQDLDDFVGNCPVLGHNVRFDLSFLNRQGILRDNDFIDTYELAAILLPTAGRYNLGALSQALGIVHRGAHRGLNDAYATLSLYQELMRIAGELPTELLGDIVRMADPFDWGAGWPLQQLFQDRVKGVAAGPKAFKGFTAAGTLFGSGRGSAPTSMQPANPPVPLDGDEAAAVLEYGGPFSKYFKEYEFRPQQVEMLRAVAAAVSDGQHLMVEAGTGTGKSFAYLVPAAMWAVANNERVVISTNTINLQDQLIQKDIPDLRAALGLDLRAVVLKGRGNYLCPRRLSAMRQRGPENVDELRVLSKIMVWLQSSISGDRNEINLNGPQERDVWMRLSAEDEGCKADTCSQRMGGSCPFYRTRQAALTAHLIIVNHALLLADVATGNRVLPDYSRLIVDEAHHLEAATTSALSFKVSPADLTRLMRELGGVSSGILGRVLGYASRDLRPSDLAAMHQAVERCSDHIFHLENHYLDFISAIEDFLLDRREGKPVSGYGQQERILEATRTIEGWTQVEIHWSEAYETGQALLALLSQVFKIGAELVLIKTDEYEEALDNLSDLHRRLTETHDYLQALVSKPKSGDIYWVEIQSGGRNALSLQVAPLHIGDLMERFIWHEKQSVILTSATLTANEGFDYLRRRLNADEADEMQVGSPFDYETAALLYLVNDIPEPVDANGYQRAVEQALVRLSKATGGRLLALFTSYQQLKRTSAAIAKPLADADIVLYEQGEGASPHALLENFRDSEKAVLLGTRAFWEGVDIPGQALSALVITKLPFDVPSDPVIAARSETFDDPFSEYHLPEAILRFRQGFGRLIRTQSDRGVVAILDKRILTKRYGKLFIDSLPSCTLKQGSLSDLPGAATRWLNL